MCAAALLAPGSAGAQEGTRLRPSLAVIEVYDDNLYFTPDPKVGDWFTRVTPGLQLNHRSAPVLFSARYDVDVDFFAQRPDLNERRARQEAAVDLDVRAGIFGYLAEGSYTETQSPRELNLTTGIGAGRIDAERWATRHLGTLHLGGVTTLLAEYAFNRDLIVDEPNIDTHTGRIGLERRLSARDSLRGSYVLRRYAFEATGQDEVAHAVLLGWTHDFTPQTRIELSAGPRVSTAAGTDESSVRPELSAALRQRFHLGELSVQYSKTQTTILGVPGTVTTDHAALGVARQLGPRLRLALTPEFFRNSNRALDVKVFRAGVETELRMTRWLNLHVSYRGSLQQGGVLAFPFADITQSIVMVRLSASAR